MLQDVNVQLLHHLDNEVETLHKAIDGDAEHAVRGCLVVDAEDRRGVGGWGGVVVDGKCTSDERRQLLINGKGLAGYGSQARGRERDVDGSVARCLSVWWLFVTQ